MVSDIELSQVIALLSETLVIPNLYQFIEHMTGIRKIDNWSRTVD
jgi:hypothetical protein